VERDLLWTYIATADARVLDSHHDMVSVFGFGDWPVLEVDLVRFLKDKGWVLYIVSVTETALER